MESHFDYALLKALRLKAPNACILLKMISNEDRLSLLCQLATKECHVAELETLLDIKQPTLSQQLGILRRAGSVETRRQGKFIYYRVTDTQVLRILELLWDIHCALPPTIKATTKKKKQKCENNNKDDDIQFQLF